MQFQGEGANYPTFDQDAMNEDAEEMEEEMSMGQRSGFTRASDAMMRTPMRSQTSMQGPYNPLLGKQVPQLNNRQPNMSLEEAFPKRPALRDPIKHDGYFEQEEYPQQDNDRPLDVKMPRMIEAHKAQSALDQQPGRDFNNLDLKNLRQFKAPVPSFLPNEEKYQKYQNVLQGDEDDLKGRLNKQRGNPYERLDETEIYDVTRKTINKKSEIPYGDPFKEHIKKMEDRLKKGASGSLNNSPRNTTEDMMRNQQRFQSVQRQINKAASDNKDTLSLPLIKADIDNMEQNMEREIDKETKLRKDAKKLIINAVRKEPTLDRNVKAWLKTERDNNNPINENQVYTQQYRKLIYQEIKKDRQEFPLMSEYMKRGIVKVNSDDLDPIQEAKLKYKQMRIVAKIEPKDEPKKFDYEMVKKLYTVSLLDSELLDPIAYLLKKKQDAKTCIMQVFKRKYEEKQLHQKLGDPMTLKKDKPAIEENLKIIKTALELQRQRLEWVLYDTPFTIKQLEDEINNAKKGDDEQYNKEKLLLKEFIKNHKVKSENYEETQQKARDARNLLNIQILEIRALKNRTGCETIADFVLMFRELIQMDKLDTAKVLLQDALVNKKKTQEFFDFIKTIISFEDEMIKLKQEFANEKFADRNFQQDKFQNYDELVLQKINVENKEDFAQQFKQEKLIFPFIPFWYTQLNGFEKNYSDILRKMLNLSIEDSKYLCNFLSCQNLNEFTTLLRLSKKQKQFILFEKEDISYLQRQHNMNEMTLRSFANLISILSKEYLMIPSILFDLAKPTQLEEINISDFKGEHLTSDAISAIVACIQNYQKNVKRLIFRNCQIDAKGAQLFKFLLSDEKKPIILCDFDNNNLGDQGIDQIMGGIKNNPKGDIRILKLSNNQLTITAAIRIASILKKRSPTLPPVNIQVLNMSHNTISNIGAETLIGFLKKNETLKYLDISFNQIGDRGLLAVADSLKDNQKLEVLNLLGNDFTDNSLRFLTEAMTNNRRSKLAIFKIGHVQSDSANFENFLNSGFLKNPSIKYLYITTNQYAHPKVQEIAENEGDNHRSLVVTEQYDAKLNSPMVLELMTQLAELDLENGGGQDQLVKFGEKILIDVIKEKYEMSNLEILIYLFEFIFAPDFNLSDNISPMHLFAKYGSLEAMYYCLRLKISPNFKTSIAYKEYPSATCLHIASGYSQLEMVKFLLTSSLTDINSKDLHGNTPLHYAGISGSLQLAQILVTNSANALVQNKKKMLPLHSCVFSDNIVTFKFILAETEKQKAKAFVGKQVEKAIDLKTYQGFTPLMVALEEKADNIFGYLIQNGADLKAQDEEGNSVLHRAILNSNSKKAKYLIKEGADIFQRTFAGETPLMLATRQGLPDVVRMLALKGADLFEKNFKGDSLLHLAARSDQAEVIGYLLDKGLKTIDVNRDGQKPMDLAQRPAIKQLLSLDNAKQHDMYSNEVSFGGKLQARIRTDQLNNSVKMPVEEDMTEREKLEAQKQGRLLNQAIIKYRIEKKDIIDSAFKSKFSNYSGGSQMSLMQQQIDDPTTTKNRMQPINTLYEDDGEEAEMSNAGGFKKQEFVLGDEEDEEEERDIMPAGDSVHPKRQRDRAMGHTKGIVGTTGGQSIMASSNPMAHTKGIIGSTGGQSMMAASNPQQVNQSNGIPSQVQQPSQQQTTQTLQQKQQTTQISAGFKGTIDMNIQDKNSNIVNSNQFNSNPNTQLAANQTMSATKVASMAQTNPKTNIPETTLKKNTIQE